jgi:hypothetical protein
LEAAEHLAIPAMALPVLLVEPVLLVDLLALQRRRLAVFAVDLPCSSSLLLLDSSRNREHTVFTLCARRRFLVLSEVKAERVRVNSRTRSFLFGPSK